LPRSRIESVQQCLSAQNESLAVELEVGSLCFGRGPYKQIGSKHDIESSLLAEFKSKAERERARL
jgi:hypothetical protein